MLAFAGHWTRHCRRWPRRALAQSALVALALVVRETGFDQPGPDDSTNVMPSVMRGEKISNLMRRPV
jgi:hypothetical protein